MAGFDGAWLEPTTRSAAARRLLYAGPRDGGDVWSQPFRLMRGLSMTGRVTGSGAALDLPLAVWTVTGGVQEGASAAWSVDLSGAWPEGAPAGGIVTHRSGDGTRVLVAAPGTSACALFAARGGQLMVEEREGRLTLRCPASPSLTLVAIGAVDRADLERTLEMLSRRGLAGLARQRIQHDEQVARGGAAIATPDDASAAARFEAAKADADAALAELPGLGRALVSRPALDSDARPGAIRTSEACRSALGMLSAGLREPVRDTLRFLLGCADRTGAVPAEVSLAGAIRSGGPGDALAFAHLARRYFAWTGDAVLRDELAPAVARADALVAGGSGEAGDSGHDRVGPGPAGPGEILLRAIEEGWGVEPDAPGGSVQLRPALPAGWSRARLSRLRVGRTILELGLRRHGTTAQFSIRKMMGPSIVVDCELPGVPAVAAELDGVSLGAARARFEATGDHELVLHAGG